ncbi:MAG: sigma-54-dependent Fis family transcriptional regulator [Deltaproteobacteria bacterium]|nr:sigma-54-dependent Fis family transcriptional regulator [Deltaproteobacteria bacterium]
MTPRDSMAGRPRVLIVDDEKLIRWSLAEELRSHGYEPLEAGNLAEARAHLETSDLELCIFDIRLPDGSGIDLLKEVRVDDQDTPIIMITGHGNVATAVEVTRAGATEYIPKPFDLREMMLVVGRASSSGREKRELRALRAHTGKGGYGELVGASASMASMFELLHRLEDADAPTVLILGESGTGKDLVARAIHRRSRRKDEPFLEIDCTGLSDALIQSELFGHERGSFTDAKARKLGLFEVAGRGSIFLDEIGELSMGTQSKLLRALENRRFKRVGGTQDIHLRARIIAATNRDLNAEVDAGRFRKDLYYRLNVIPVQVPPLRDRAGDVERLVEFFVRRLAADMGRPTPRVTSAARERLVGYEWPGNVRELRNVLERAVILCREAVIGTEDLPGELGGGGAPAMSSGRFLLPEDGLDLAALERDLVNQALERTGHNQSQAARLLGIGRFALRYRMEKMGLLPGRDAGA